MRNHNTDLPPAEYVPVDSYLQNLLWLEIFPSAKGKLAPYLIPVENVFPCVDCQFPIARLSVAGYVRIVDCYRDKSTSSQWNEVTNWQADVLSEHSCSGSFQ